MSDRYVLVRVTDPRVDRIDVIGWPPPPIQSLIADCPVEHSPAFIQEQIPVPEDDQLLRDLDMLTTEFARFAVTSDSLGLKYEAAMRLRAAAGLDQEDDNE